MSNTKVTCQCCGKSMVPTTIFSRGIYGGWGWRIGGGRPVSSCCPFCLSENWDDATKPVDKTVFQKTILVVTLCLFAYLGHWVLTFFLNDVLMIGSSPWLDTASQWLFVALAIFLYHRHKFEPKKKGL